MKESALEAKCRKYVVERGCLFIKNQGTRGFPDRTIIGPTGHIVFVEFKRPGSGVLSELQKYTMMQLQDRCCHVFVVDDFSAFQDIVGAYVL